MKFQLKALAAAVVLAAAIPAQANLVLPSTGNGSSILVLIDSAKNLTATFDLGLNYLNFNTVASAGAIGSNNALTGTGLTVNLASSTNANYAATLSAFTTAGGTLANSSWAFLSADGLGQGVGAQGLFTSFAGAGAATQTNPLGTAIGAWNTALTTLNTTNLLGTSTLSATTTGAALQGTAIPAVYNLATGKLNNAGAVIFGAVGSTALGVNQYISGSSAFVAATNNIFTGATMTLDANGLFTYSTAATVAAVPETNTWAMAMLGLGFMGFVARRKQA
jgi:hypothetical protein